MAHTLESFSAECHRILKAEPAPEGRQNHYRSEAMRDQILAFEGEFRLSDTPIGSQTVAVPPGQTVESPPRRPHLACPAIDSGR